MKTTGAVAMTSVRIASAASKENLNKPSVIVDTHLHCFAGTDDKRFPYHERAPYRPEEAATPQHLLRCMDEGGIDYAIVVHPEPYQDDHRYLEYCLGVGEGRLKGTCLFFADRAGSIEQLPALARRTPLVAARVHAYVADRLPPFGTPELRRLWTLATDHGLAMQLHFEPKYAPGFEPLIREFKDTTVLIDHLGRPYQGTPEEHDKVIGWSRFPNVVVKLSSIPSDRNYPHRQISPTIKRLIDAFGPDRLMYGGGYGADATGDSYRAVVERCRSFLQGLSVADQAKVLGNNAARVFRFDTGRRSQA